MMSDTSSIDQPNDLEIFSDSESTLKAQSQKTTQNAPSTSQDGGKAGGENEGEETDQHEVTSLSKLRKILFPVCILTLIISFITYFIIVFTLYDTGMTEQSRQKVQMTFNSRGGDDTFIIGDQLLTPEQRIEDLGIIRQRSNNPNHENTLAFLSDIEDTNPPDLYRTLISPTIDPTLIERNSSGSLPKMSSDGRSSLIAYARPFNEDLNIPQISIVILELGISETLARAAIHLRPEVSLAFSPYAQKLQPLITEARKAGHEIILELPLEPINYPLQDPGPYALRKQFSIEKNISKLEWILSRAEGYIGLINFQGDALLKDQSFVQTFIPLITRRGLAFFENGQHKNYIKNTLEQNDNYHTQIDINIGLEDDEFTINEKFARSLTIADEKGRVTIAIKPYPLLLMKLGLWIKELPDDQYALTPLSSEAQLQEARRLGLEG